MAGMSFDTIKAKQFIITQLSPTAFKPILNPKNNEKPTTSI